MTERAKYADRIIYNSDITNFINKRSTALLAAGLLSKDLFKELVDHIHTVEVCTSFAHRYWNVFFAVANVSGFLQRISALRVVESENYSEEQVRKWQKGLLKATVMHVLGCNVALWFTSTLCTVCCILCRLRAGAGGRGE